MMLKTVYGPPPEDAERIEDFELEGENGIREDEIARTAPSVVSSRPKRQTGDGA